MQNKSIISKRYLSLWNKIFFLKQNLSFWNQIFFWDEIFLFGTKFFFLKRNLSFWSEIFLFETKCFLFKQILFLKRNLSFPNQNCFSKQVFFYNRNLYLLQEIATSYCNLNYHQIGLIMRRKGRVCCECFDAVVKPYLKFFEQFWAELDQEELTITYHFDHGIEFWEHLKWYDKIESNASQLHHNICKTSFPSFSQLGLPRWWYFWLQQEVAIFCRRYRLRLLEKKLFKKVSFQEERNFFKKKDFVSKEKKLVSRKDLVF